jgi:HD-GYP domain-containing protein (c-di-GMP phosphodiesterase class II)
MADIKRKETAVEGLSIGMYVVDLDRSWDGTPFLLQGFIIQDEYEIASLKKLCTFVYIDHTKSTGDYFLEDENTHIGFRPESLNDNFIRTSDMDASNPPISNIQNGYTDKNAFLEILLDLKNYKANQNKTDKRNRKILFNMNGDAQSALKNTTPYEKTGNQSEKNEVKQLTGGIFEFFSRLLKRDKYNPNVDDVPLASNLDADYHDTVIYEEEYPVENEMAKVLPVYELSQIEIRKIFESITNLREIDLNTLSELIENMFESISRTPDALLWLSKLKTVDDYSYNHALEVSITMMAFSNFLALSKREVLDMGLIGILLDIGKIKLTSEVFLKEGKLTKQEYDYVKKHVDESVKIIESNPIIKPSVLQAVAQHHERADGSGYPDDLTVDQISLSGQIAGLIDTYCAITSHKTYAKALCHHQALDIIYNLRGKLFSHILVDQLVQFMGLYPVSSLVELNTGEVAVVIQQNKVRRLMPRLMLLLDNKKERYTSPIILNLLNCPLTSDGERYSIIKSLVPEDVGLNPSDFFF